MNVKYLIIHPPVYIKAGLFVILAFFHIRYGIIPGWNKINSDFPNYYTSSKLILEGKNMHNIYNDKWFQQKIYEYGINEPGKFSPFPPPTVFVLVPEAYFNPLTAKRIYLLINVILIFGISYLIRRITGFHLIDVFNIILLSGIALVNNFLFGQFYLVLLLLITLDYYFLNMSEKYTAGIFWGIGAAIKYVPVIYLPVVILKRKWKVFLSFLTTFIFINLLTMLVLGYEVYIRFFQTVLFSHLNGELSSQSKYAVQFQSWNSLLRNVFVYDKLENPNPLINNVFLFNSTRILVYLIFLILSGVIIYRLRNNRNIVPFSFIILTILLFVLTPASASYHLLLLVIPVVLLLKLSEGRHTLYNIAFLVLYILICFSPFVINRIDRHGWGLILSYSRLWLEVILYIVSSVFVFILPIT
jgi:hypothetical protein